MRARLSSLVRHRARQPECGGFPSVRSSEPARTIVARRMALATFQVSWLVDEGLLTP